MTTAIAPPREASRATPGRDRITVAEYHRRIDAGELTEEDRVELLNGEIVPKMPIGSRHLGTVNRLVRVFTGRLANRATVSPQNPVTMTAQDSEPEPDVSILRFRADDYTSAKPTPADTLLVIEVSDSSLDRDRGTKAPLYARAGIPEYWIVCLDSDAVEVRRGPIPDGSWREVRTYRRGESLSPSAFPDLTLSVDDVLPAA